MLEAGWAIGLKASDGFSKLWPSVWTACAIAASMYLLSVAARTIPIGTAYAVWVGIGALGAVVLGAIFYDEPIPPPRVVFVVLLLVSIVGLKITSVAPVAAP
jgi:quaternary ammonium compound-resistance protein SugE